MFFKKNALHQLSHLFCEWSTQTASVRLEDLGYICIKALELALLSIEFFFSAMCCLISRMERFQVRNSKRALKNQQKANHLPIYLLLSNFSLTHNSEQLTLTVRIELNIFHDYWLVVLKKKRNSKFMTNELSFFVAYSVDAASDS